MQEGRLHVDAEQHTEPDQVDTELFGDRPEQRHDDERKLEVIEKEGQHEDQDIDDDQEAELAAGQVDKQVLDPQVAVDVVEGQRENAGADQDEHNERGQFCCAFHGLLEQLEIEPSACQRHQQGAGGAHGTAFGRGRDAEEDGAQHEEDQAQRRNQDEGDLFRHLRQQTQLQGLVDNGQDERHENADHRAHDDEFVGWKVVRP